VSWTPLRLAVVPHPLLTDPLDKVLTAVKGTAVRRVSLPVHHIVVNPCDSLWLVGMTATVIGH
jgi:hypothetical protein